MQKQESCQAFIVQKSRRLQFSLWVWLLFFRLSAVFADHYVVVEYIIKDQAWPAKIIGCNHMKRLFVCLLITVWLPTSAALAKEAALYFDLASKSSSANKKIEYYSKALEKDPRTYFYRHLSAYASLEEMRTGGLIGIIVLASVLILGLKFKAPKKDE